MTRRAMTRRRGAEAGFTLVEMLAVLVILGLVVSLALARGPARNATLDGRAAAALVAQTLRSARLEAITGNRTVTVVFDTAANRFGVAGGRTTALPRGMALSVTATAPLAAGARGGIGFAPDGSSTGGTVGLLTGGRRFLVAVNWLTGRVGVTEAVPALPGGAS